MEGGRPDQAGAQHEGRAEVSEVPKGAVMPELRKSGARIALAYRPIRSRSRGDAAAVAAVADPAHALRRSSLFRRFGQPEGLRPRRARRPLRAMSGTGAVRSGSAAMAGSRSTACHSANRLLPGASRRTPRARGWACRKAAMNSLARQTAPWFPKRQSNYPLTSRRNPGGPGRTPATLTDPHLQYLLLQTRHGPAA